MRTHSFLGSSSRNWLVSWSCLIAQNRKYTPFARPVDPNVVPDYYDIVKEPMDLSLIQENIDMGAYLSPQQFMKDLQLVVSNVVRYNPRHDPNRLVHRAHAMLVRRAPGAGPLARAVVSAVFLTDAMPAMSEH